MLTIGYSQSNINDCPNAQVICSNADLDFNPFGAGTDDFRDMDNDAGCLVTRENHSAWYYFEIENGAPSSLTLGFIIHPEGGLGEDYDWALYGPNPTCGNLGSPVRCSSSSNACDFCPETGMGMGTFDISEGPGSGDGFVKTLEVHPGEGFYLLIDNWNGSSKGFVLEWTDTAADYLNCDAEPPCELRAKAGEDITVIEGHNFPIQLSGGNVGGHNSATYSWSGTNGGTDFLSDIDIANPTILLPKNFNGTIIYTLNVVEDTCVSKDELVVIVVPLNPDIYIPTAFSPNDDGINDVFYISGAGSQITKIKKFIIYNRWGGLMHETSDFFPDDLTKAWDGHYKNVKMDPGVYVYVAEVEFIGGLVKVYRGDVTIME